MVGGFGENMTLAALFFVEEMGELVFAASASNAHFNSLFVV